MRERVLAWIGSWVIRLLRWTFRVRYEGPLPGAGRPRIFAFHHGRQLALFEHERSRPVAVLSSLSRDGRLQARILARLGFLVLDGSSSNGGAKGLAALVRRVRGGADAAFAVDGPKGPHGTVKPGVVLAAKRTGGIIVPLCASARRAVRLRRTWDRYLLPLPFARILVRRGDPIEVPAEARGPDLEGIRLRLEASLDRLAVECDGRTGAS